MKSVVKGVVSKEFSNKPLLEFLKFGLNLSSSLIKKAKRIENGILVNNKLCYVNQIVYENDAVIVTVETEDEKSENIPFCDIPLNIVYEDEDLLVIDKDGGIPTHPSLNNYDISVAGAVMNYYKKQNINFVFRPVNRLDKGTSGLMIVAKNPHIHELLKKQMHSGDFLREYLAIVCGVDNSIIKRVVDVRGVNAITHYESIKVYNDKTLIKLRLETGRTHQIRVHMAYIGHSLYGDFLYGKEADNLKRPALHSYKIVLKNPITNERLEFISPLKDDMKNIL